MGIVKHFITVLVWLSLSLISQAEVIDASAGYFKTASLNPTKGVINFTIESLHDTDKKWAPTTKLDFFNESDELGYSVGIIKLDGKQGIVAFYVKGILDNSIERKFIKSNLALNTPYEFNYEYIGKNRLNLIIAGRRFSMDIGFKPSKVKHLVSGMTLHVGRP